MSCGKSRLVAGLDEIPASAGFFVLWRAQKGAVSVGSFFPGACGGNIREGFGTIWNVGNRDGAKVAKTDAKGEGACRDCLGGFVFSRRDWVGQFRAISGVGWAVACNNLAAVGMG
jgi:hypothetical protein